MGAAEMTFGMECRRVPKRQQVETVSRVAKLLQIEALLGSQAVATLRWTAPARGNGARTGARSAAVPVDEPLSNLDAKLRVEMRMEITSGVISAWARRLSMSPTIRSRQ
jgi:multiple sugar transport system ATP-binding protein